MKTQYESPEMRVHLVQLEMCILSNGENVNVEDHSDDDGFWKN